MDSQLESMDLGWMQMQYVENPKLKGSGLIACVPQDGPCPFGCKDCFANAANSYLPEHLSNIPTPEQAAGRVVRVNDANDSNNQRELVIAVAEQYPDAFYNTSRPKLDFPGPVVLTLNPGEKTDQSFWRIEDCGLKIVPKNLMFVRFRTNVWNEILRNEAVEYWTMERGVPLVLVFMAYHEEPVMGVMRGEEIGYTQRKRTLNTYWAIRPDVWKMIMKSYQDNSLVYSCGEGPQGSIKCERCGNCLREYFATKERMKAVTPV